MTDNLTSRITTALNQLEQTALVCPPWPWRLNDEHDEILADDGEPVCTALALSGPQTRSTAEHIVGWHPGIVLDLVAAHREILADHPAVTHRMSWDEEWIICARCRYDGGLNVIAWPCPTVRAIAKAHRIETPQ